MASSFTTEISRLGYLSTGVEMPSKPLSLDPRSYFHIYQAFSFYESKDP
jgi:hypothetical protein